MKPMTPTWLLFTALACTGPALAAQSLEQIRYALYKNPQADVSADLRVLAERGDLASKQLLGDVLANNDSAVRELGDRLRNDCVLREFRLAFRHPCVVVCLKDSQHHCCAWRHELQHVEIRPDCGHLGRVVHEVHGIRLLPP